MTATIESPQELGARFNGRLIGPGDEGYDEARRVHNGLIDKHPALIARCLTTADVVDAVRFGRAHASEISVRGGGHNVAGKAVTDGGLMIDMALMKGVRVDPRRRTIWAQGGVIWNELNRAGAAWGLATTGGVVSSTGIAGLTLGGGEGWLMGRYGLAIDNLLSVELVTADGEIVIASDDHHQDLFWALRGGGGNFGVATAFEYRAHPVASVLGGMVAHPLDRGREVFSFYRSLTAEIPDELTVYAALVHTPDGSEKVAAMSLCHCGDDPVGAETDVAALRRFGPPALDVVAPMPYPTVNTLMDDAFPRGALSYWKSGILREITDEAAAVMVECFEQCPSTMTAIVIVPYLGAVTRVAPTATAFPHREPCYSLVILSEWRDPAETESNVVWTRETFDALRPYLTDAAYLNNLPADDSALVREAWGPNYDRLVEVKRRYDPSNVFRLNHNIDPAG